MITLYKFNLLMRDYPALILIINNVMVVRQGESPKSTIVQVQFKNFVN